MTDTPRFSRRRLLGLGIVAATVGAAGLSYRSLANPLDGVTTLGVADAYAQAASGDILLVDIRRPDEWERTGVPANALPLDMRRPDFVSALQAELSARGTPPVAVICARGVRSKKVTGWLHEAGVTRIIDVPEGMLGSFAGPGWLKAGLPVSPAPAT